MDLKLNSDISCSTWTNGHHRRVGYPFWFQLRYAAVVESDNATMFEDTEKMTICHRSILQT